MFIERFGSKCYYGGMWLAYFCGSSSSRKVREEEDSSHPHFLRVLALASAWIVALLF